MGKLMHELVICPSPENKFSIYILLKVKNQNYRQLGYDPEDYKFSS